MRNVLNYALSVDYTRYFFQRNTSSEKAIAIGISKDDPLADIFDFSFLITLQKVNRDVPEYPLLYASLFPQLRYSPL